MSYNEFIAEREKIDFLLERGYQIVSVHEDLDGAFVSFQKAEDRITLHIQTADARKYFSVKLLR
ncbi:hypothetical protein MUG87_03315 [Ectobacillus sp. JY-23]|uniref:hypothetical protein n=1 Tax=Ectobacillus sp. JY-23 TaxID=2933872 RepID=UPI001FF4931F|nr:hypothetical protein [Ectobacillus sp. JY-23]UOY93175.1 hypothetical protein MUG87_03315 [Ectobacillus sp. JY-23]